MTPLLELKDIRRSYPAGDEQVEVLKGISLDIYAGEMVAIVGASGSGKSTLMNILGCLDKATSGTYRVAGQDVATLDADALAQLRREHFGFIFQRYHLLSHLTAEQNVEVPAVYAGLERKQRLLRAQELLQRLGLEDRTEYYPAQLSGGQQQRVSIARALMNGGQVILADEPTGALDSHSGEEVMAILHQLRDRGHTVIIVTHDPQVAAQAERVIEIRDGEIVRNPPAIEKVNVTGGTEPVVNTVSGWRQFVSGFNEALTMAWRALAANKMRTLLTMLGIIIGIASVVSIVVVGDAAKQMVLADIRSIGTNTIDVYPGKDFGDDFTGADSGAGHHCTGIGAVLHLRSKAAYTIVGFEQFGVRPSENWHRSGGICHRIYDVYRSVGCGWRHDANRQRSILLVYYCHPCPICSAVWC